MFTIIQFTLNLGGSALLFNVLNILHIFSVFSDPLFPFSGGVTIN